MDNLFESSMRLLLDYTRALHLSLAGPNFVALLTAEFCAYGALACKAHESMGRKREITQ